MIFYQESLTGDRYEPLYLRDMDCTKNTPVELGRECEPLELGQPIYPRVPGRKDTPFMQKVYLDHVDPLETYDDIIILFSGGKDSTAAFFAIKEMMAKISKDLPEGLLPNVELWHHNLDGSLNGSTRQMDWPYVTNYCRAFAAKENVKLRISWRKGGFFGELERLGASGIVEWQDPDSMEVFHCKPSRNQLICEDIRRRQPEDMEEQLKAYGFRNKWPAKGSITQGRWCSSALKKEVSTALITSGLARMKQNRRILLVSGERRGESCNRVYLNEMEVESCNAEAKLGRTVHHWRPVVDYTERDVWEVLKRHKVAASPCYRAGWNRCSCKFCIFSAPSMWQGLKTLYPEEFERVCEDEKRLNFTIDNTKSLKEFMGDAKSCLCMDDKKAIHAMKTGEFSLADVYVDGEWEFPAGAFHGAEGGPC